jgi:hypothetical protein
VVRVLLPHFASSNRLYRLAWGWKARTRTVALEIAQELRVKMHLSPEDAANW